MNTKMQKKKNSKNHLKHQNPRDSNRQAYTVTVVALYNVNFICIYNFRYFLDKHVNLFSF